MPAALPFAGLLEALRDKGYPIGLHEHLALGKLLDRWDDTDPSRLGDAIAALVGRDAEEIDEIRAFFAQVYAPPSTPRVAPVAAPPAAAADRWVRALAGAAALVIAGFLIWIWATYPRGTIQPVEPLPPPAQVVVEDVPGAPVAAPPPTAPEPPPAPVRISTRIAVAAGAVGFLAALLWSWGRKAQIATRRWLRRAWRAALGALPGPYDYNLATQGLRVRLPHADVEDAATILARIYAGELMSRELDVTASLQLTLSGGLPRIVFKPVQVARPILVLQDIGADMGRWRSKVDAFLLDLRRQGIALERWYFDADIRRVSERPHGPPHLLEALTGKRSDAPLLVVSGGSGLAAVATVADLSWRRALEACPRRAWLTPIADRRLWPDELSDMPVTVWPMTRRGLTQAARELAGQSEAARPRTLHDVRVTREDVIRMRQLASLVPQETPDVLELLRQQFAPDVPDAVHEWLIRETRREPPDPGARPDDRATLLHALRREAPRLEADARARIIAWLRASEPPIGSAAHLRWQKDLALQEVALASLTGGDVERPLAALTDLAAGPLWEEVRESVLLLPPVEGLSERLKSVTGPADGRGTPPPDDGQLSGWLRRPRLWPGLREASHACAALAVVLAAGWGLRLFPSQLLAHVEGAFDLALARNAGAALPSLVVTGARADLPRTVGLYQDGKPYRAPVALQADGRASIPLSEAEMGHYYQVHATLPAGNLALSQQVWVAAAGTTVVLIDAMPWARITIDGTGIAGQTTPVRVALRPGTYRVSFENGGLTPPTTETLTVTADGKPLRVVMPGFRPEDAATAGRPPR